MSPSSTFLRQIGAHDEIVEFYKKSNSISRVSFILCLGVLWLMFRNDSPSWTYYVLGITQILQIAVLILNRKQEISLFNEYVILISGNITAFFFCLMFGSASGFALYFLLGTVVYVLTRPDTNKHVVIFGSLLATVGIITTLNFIKPLGYLGLTEKNLTMLRSINLVLVMSTVLRLSFRTLNRLKSQRLALFQKQKEVSIQRNLLNGVISNLSEGIFRIDESNKLQFYNIPVIQLLGITESETLDSINLRVFFLPPRSYDLFMLKLRKYGSVKNIEVTIKRKDGHMFPAIISGSKLTDEDGINYFDGSITDISTIKAAQKIADDTAVFYQSVFDHLPIDVAIFNPEHQFLFVAKHAVNDPEIREWLIGKTNLEYCIEKGKDTQIAFLRNKYFEHALKTKKLVSWEENGITSTGDPKTVLRNYFPVINSQGEIDIVLGYGLDVTPLKQTEEKLILHNEELKTLNEELDRLVYGASHHLRAPIATVLGLIELSRMTEDGLLHQAYLEHMESSLNRLDSFITDLTNYSRNNRFDIVPEEIDFKGFYLNHLQQNMPYELKDIFKIEINIQQTAKFFQDKRRLEIIFNNLISNGIKYRKIGENADHKLSFEATILDDKAMLTFRDHGRGIPSSQKDKIFEMFYRASSDTKGSGIGLFIVREVVMKMGGQIEVHSEEGQWTEFFIELPCLPEQVEAATNYTYAN